MVEMTGIYQGQKRCELTHGPSKTKIQTDAPKDNLGLGGSFSPTDLVGAALASCVLTTLAIACEKEGVDLNFEGAKFTIKKEMQSSPRKISKLHILFEIPGTIPHERRAWIERVAHHCPVRMSLAPDISIVEEFLWN